MKRKMSRRTHRILKKITMTLLTFFVIVYCINPLSISVNAEAGKTTSVTTLMEDGAAETEIAINQSEETTGNTGDTLQEAAQQIQFSQVTVIGTVEERNGKSLALLNIILLLGIILLAFLSSAKSKMPIASYVALAVAMITFVLTTGFSGFIFVNHYSIIFGMGIVVGITEYYLIQRKEKKVVDTKH